MTLISLYIVCLFCNSAMLLASGHGLCSGIKESEPSYERPEQEEAGVFYFEDDNRKLQVAYTDRFNPSTKSIDPNSDIGFYLYTHKNPRHSQRLMIGDRSVKKSHFDHHYPTIFLIHGYTNSYKSSFTQGIKNEYLNGHKKLNVIAVDWKKLCMSPWYATAVNNTMLVGRHTAKLVDFMVKEAKLSLLKLHIIGHSLGAHTAAIVGKHVRSGKVSRITALDPAKPLYERARPMWRVTPNDAKLVDVIHTNGGKLGLLAVLGDIDFYPNGGSSQPGCEFDRSGSCSHSRAWEYYLESVTQTAGFPGKKCPTIKAALKGRCHKLMSIVPMMGAGVVDDDESAPGIFYVKTNKEKPFSMNN